MDSLWQLAQRLLADPIVVIYWFLAAFCLGLYGGWRIERTHWESRITIGDACPYCQEELHKCEHLRRRQASEKQNWIDRLIQAFMIQVLGWERRDEEGEQKKEG